MLTVEKRHGKLGKSGLDKMSISKSQKRRNQVSRRVSAHCWHATPLHIDLMNVMRDDYMKTKRKRSDSVLWQKPLHQQKCQKGKVATQTTPQKVRLNSNCGPTYDGQLE